MEGFVEFDASLHALDDQWDVEAEFAAVPADFAPEPRRKASAAEEADDAAWLFRQASQREKADLGVVECRSGRVNVGDRVRALVRTLADEGDNPARRAEALAEVAELRLACRRTDGWRSSDYSWPLLSD